LSYANISSRRKRRHTIPTRQARHRLSARQATARQAPPSAPTTTFTAIIMNGCIHSIQPKEPASQLFRTTIGGAAGTKPYSASVFNISAICYGSLSANAIRALNNGAKLGDFAHDTGEGGVGRYHREHGGDLIWEVGSGYFCCRNKDGSFCPEKFAGI